MYHLYQISSPSEEEDATMGKERLDPVLEDKYRALRGIIEGLGSALVAFSGGVDSTLLAKVAADCLGDRAVAVTAVSPTYPVAELTEARRLAEEIGIRQILIRSEELEIPGFTQNTPDRCYLCKAELIEKMWQIARQEGMDHILLGMNFDDRGDFRPGTRAAREKGVRMPLEEAGLTKEEVRRLARSLGLSNWDKPSFACLSSRFPYGEEITAEKLARVEQAEDLLRSLGFRQFRVRHHQNIARLELEPSDLARFAQEELRSQVTRRLKELGFAYVTLDLEGYRTGSLNEVLCGSSPRERRLASRTEGEG